MEEKALSINKLAIYTVLLFTPFSTYFVISNSFTLGDLLLFITFAILLVNSIKKLRIDNKTSENTNKNEKTIKMALPLLIYMTSVLVLTLMHWILEKEDIGTGALSVLRYLFYLAFVLIVSKNYFDVEDSIGAYKNISLIFALYAIAQWICFYFFHKCLPINILGNIGLRTSEQVYVTDTVSRYIGTGIIYRPSSFFIEPAHFVAYQAPILYILANIKTNHKVKIKNNKVIDKDTNLKYAIIIAISILLSGSTTGIFVLIFCLFSKILQLLKKNIAKTFLYCLLVLFGCIIFLNTSYGETIFKRTISTEKYGAIQSRFGHFDEIKKIESADLIIGNGFKNNQEVYLPSFLYLLVSYGIVGVVSFIIMVIITYINCNKIGKNIIALFLMMMLGTLVLFGTNVILYLVFIYSSYYTSGKKATI